MENHIWMKQESAHLNGILRGGVRRMSLAPFAHRLPVPLHQSSYKAIWSGLAPI
jgi:hypothetical protein